MASFLDELLKKMKTAPHVGIPPVTNPKVPTKVERDAAEYAEKKKNMSGPKVINGTFLSELLEQMKNASHPAMTYADSAVNNSYTLSPAEVAATNVKLEAFMQMLREKKAKRKQEQLAALTTKTNTTENTIEE